MSEKRFPAGVRILLAIASILLCLLLFVSTVVTIIVADVRLVTSKDGLQTIITQALFPSSAPVRLPTSGLAVGRPAGYLAETDFGNEAQSAIVDAVYGMLTEQFGDELPISQEQVSQFLDESTLPEFLSEKVAGIVNDIYTGSNTTTITKEEVVDLLKENAPIIEDQLGVVIRESEIEIIGDWVEESNVMDTVQEQISQITGMAPPAKPNAPGDGSSGSSSSGSASSGSVPSGSEVISGLMNGGDDSEIGLPELLAVVRTLTSVTALLICIGVCLLLTGLLFLTHWGRPFAAMRTAGIPVMIAGIVISIPSILALAVPGIFTDTIMIVVRQILALTGYVSIGVAVLGLGLIICGCVLGSRLKKKKAAKAAPVETAPEAPVEAAPVAAAEASAEAAVTEE